MKKFSYEHVKNQFAKFGAELLEEQYKASNKPLRYKCRCGFISTTTLTNFLLSGHCRRCSGTMPPTFYEMKQHLDQHGCVLLEEVTTSTEKFSFICSCKKIGHTTWTNFKRSDNKCCRSCYRLKCSGFNNNKWNPDREQLLLKQKFHRRCCALLNATFKRTGQNKSKKKSEILGYSSEDLRRHIMSHPNWNSVKNTAWHIDHVYPVSAFVKMGITDPCLINDLDNLQPLTRTENLSKSDVYNTEQFLNWLESKGVCVTA